LKIINLLKKLRNNLFFFPALPFVIIIFLISRLLQSFLLIRVGRIVTERIGHFAGNIEVYLLEKIYNIDQPSKMTIDIWFIDNDISNEFLKLLIIEKLIIGPRFIFKYVYRLNKIFSKKNKSIKQYSMYKDINVKNSKFNSDSKFIIPQRSDRDIYSLRSNTEPLMRFSDSQIVEAKKKLEKFGITNRNKYVALMVRDSSYLSKTYKDQDWNYHNYRDCEIDNYLLAAEFLTQKGFHVLRMGKFVNKSLITNNKMIIDYANSNLRSDFLDIYIGATCEFCISTGNGYDKIPAMFRRPIVFCDHAPIGNYPTYMPQSIGIFKHYFSITENKKINLSEIVAKKSHLFHINEQFKNAGIKLVDNSPEEIKDVCSEMVDRLSNNWVENKSDIILQKKFWECYPSKYSQTYFHSPKLYHKKISSKIGAIFLRNNINLIR